MQFTNTLPAEKEIAIDKIYYDFSFYLVLVFLLFEYGRPQSFVPAIGALHPGIIIQLLLLILLFKKRKILNFKNVQSKFFLAIVLLMTIHVPIDVNNYWAYITWQSTTLYLIVYLSIISFVDSFRKVEKYIDVWLAINLIGAVIGIKCGGKIPDSSFMGDENDFALVMNMAIPFAYFSFQQATSRKKKLYYAAAIIIFLLGDIASLSRGGFLGLVAVSCYCWYKSPNKVASSIVIFLLMATFYLAVDQLSPERDGKRSSYWAEIRSIKEENMKTGTGEGRWYAWKIGWRIFLDNPFIGVGPNNYPWNSPKYQPRADTFERAGVGGRAAHSLYATLISELGIVGCFLFFGMFYACFKDLKEISRTRQKYSAMKNGGRTDPPDADRLQQLKKIKVYSLAVKGSFIGYFVSGTFLSVLYYPHFWLLVALAVTLHSAAKTYLPSTVG